MLAILSLGAALVAPSLMRFARHQNAMDAAADLLALTRHAQAQAVRDGAPCRLHVAPETGMYWLTHQRNGGFAALADSFGKPVALPPNVSVEWDRPDPTLEGHIQFEPDGTHEPATLRVRDQVGVVARVAGEFPAEPFRLLEPASDREVGR